MNRYVVDGMLEDMRNGKRVLLVTTNTKRARDWLDLIVQRRCCACEQARRSWRFMGLTAEEGNGHIQIMHANDPDLGYSQRGMRIDILFIDTKLTEQQEAALLPCAIRGEVMKP